MDKEARRAHLILQGQTLLDEWLEHCRMWRNAETCDDALAYWRRAVAAEFGPDWSVVFVNGNDCELPNGEYYVDVPNPDLIGETK